MMRNSSAEIDIRTRIFTAVIAAGILAVGGQGLYIWRDQAVQVQKLETIDQRVEDTKRDLVGQMTDLRREVASLRSLILNNRRSR